jgi:hypothetical protein
MLDLLRDAAWQFFGVLLAFIAIIVAIAIYYRQKQRKELAFGLLSARNLVTVSDQVAGRVQITFDGVPVKNIQLVVIGLKNSGDKPLLAADFERPVTVGFGSRAKVLSAGIAKQSPANLGAEVIFRESQIQVSPLLLNSDDYLIVQVLLAAPSFEIKPDVRIVGVSALVPLNSGLRLRPGDLWNLAVNVLICAGFGGLAFIYGASLADLGPSAPLSSPSRSSLWAPIVPGGVIAIGLTLLTLRRWIVGRFKNNDRRYISDY